MAAWAWWTPGGWDAGVLPCALTTIRSTWHH